MASASRWARMGCCVMAKPIPLRDLITEQIETVVEAEVEYAKWGSMDNARAAVAARDELARLVAQIPVVFEARDPENKVIER
jgi:hypothetical protein